MTDLLVDRLEVVDVEEDQREPAIVPVGALHLLGERLVEVVTVVQPGERVAHGELEQLVEAAGILERATGHRGQLFDRGDLLLAGLVDRTAPEDAERSHEVSLARR